MLRPASIDREVHSLLRDECPSYPPFISCCRTRAVGSRGYFVGEPVRLLLNGGRNVRCRLARAAGLPGPERPGAREADSSLTPGEGPSPRGTVNRSALRDRRDQRYVAATVFGRRRGSRFAARSVSA